MKIGIQVSNKNLIKIAETVILDAIGLGLKSALWQWEERLPEKDFLKLIDIISAIRVIFRNLFADKFKLRMGNDFENREIASIKIELDGSEIF